MGVKTNVKTWLVMLLLLMMVGTTFAGTPWKFIITGDSQVYGEVNGFNDVIIGELASESVNQGVDFVLFSGDLVKGGTETQLNAWVSTMQPVYNADINVYPVRGNHDYKDIPDGSTWLNVFGPTAPSNQKLPDNGPPGEEYMTYSFTHKNAFIIGLDEYVNIQHVNQPWLDGQLATNTEPHVFVFGHLPAFRTRNIKPGLDDDLAARNKFWESIKNAGGRTYFCGHEHFYNRARVDNGDSDPNNDIYQCIIGTSGATLYNWPGKNYPGHNEPYTVNNEYHAKQFGYVMVEINDLDVTLTWMQRNTPGNYEPNEVWSYTAVLITVLAPNGGEPLMAGSIYTIRWGSRVYINDVLIEYSTNNGQDWNDVNTVPNTGSYEWNQVPEANSNECLVRITDANDTAVYDSSDKVFTIFECQGAIVGDLNNDCYLQFADFTILADQWFQAPTDPSADIAPNGGDGIVDFFDLTLLVGNWLDCGNPFDASCGVQ